MWLLAQRYKTTVSAIIAANPGVDSNLIMGQVICIDPGKQISEAEVNLMKDMRMLWEQHVAWTRMTINSIAENLPDLDFVTNRLLCNASDMAAALKTFYGEENASRFESLLRDLLVIAAELVKAAKAGDSQAAADAERRWYANVDEIAAFLNSINPNWSKEEWMSMLHEQPSTNER